MMGALCQRHAARTWRILLAYLGSAGFEIRLQAFRCRSRCIVPSQGSLAEVGRDRSSPLAFGQGGVLAFLGFCIRGLYAALAQCVLDQPGDALAKVVDGVRTRCERCVLHHLKRLSVLISNIDG